MLRKWIRFGLLTFLCLVYESSAYALPTLGKETNNNINQALLRSRLETVELSLPDGSTVLGQKEIKSKTIRKINGNSYLIESYGGAILDKDSREEVGNFSISKVNLEGQEAFASYGIINKDTRPAYVLRATTANDLSIVEAVKDTPINNIGCGFEVQGRMESMAEDFHCEEFGCGSSSGGGYPDCWPHEAVGRIDIFVAYTQEACVAEAQSYYQQTCDAGQCNEIYNINECTEAIHHGPVIAGIHSQETEGNVILNNSQIPDMRFAISGTKEIEHALPNAPLPLDVTDWLDDTQHENCPLFLETPTTFYEELCLERRATVSDLIHVLVAPGQLDECGIAKGSLNGGLFGVPARKGIAFSASRTDCLPNRIMPHEWAHNLGADHEFDTETAAASFSHAYSIVNSRYTIMNANIGTLPPDISVVPYFSQAQDVNFRNPEGEILETETVFDWTTTLQDGSEVGDPDHNNAATLYKTKGTAACFKDSNDMDHIDNYRFGDNVHEDYPGFPADFEFSGSEINIGDNCLSEPDVCQSLDPETPRYMGIASLKHDVDGTKPRHYTYIDIPAMPNTEYRVHGVIKNHLTQGAAVIFTEVLDSSDRVTHYYGYDVDYVEQRANGHTWLGEQYTVTTPYDTAKLRILLYTLTEPLHVYDENSNIVHASDLDCGEVGYDDRWFDEEGSPTTIYCPIGDSWFGEVHLERIN